MADTHPRSPARSRSPQADDTNAATGRMRIIGIGAGAGGLEAIQLLFAGMPDDRNLAFVICRNLPSDFADPIGELLRQQIAMPIHDAVDGTALEGNAIYLMPPRARMILLKDRLISFDDDEDGLSVSPLDLFLHALAASEGADAIAVILSGAGQDGLRGAVSIRRAGGLVLAQDPEDAEFAAMPSHVIEAELASAIAPPAAMAGLIKRHVGSRRTPSVEVLADGPDSAALARIFALLKARYDIDLDAYRPSMAARRVRRRAALSKAVDLDGYASLLAVDDQELERIYDDLLIGVTAFFRDPDAFSALGDKVVPELLGRMSAGRPIRVWVPACATGEEAYSLAMLMLDQIAGQQKTCHLEIIATDRHQKALEQARLGRYRQDRVLGLPPDLINRYMEDQGDHIQVRPEVRDIVTFAEHDLIHGDPLEGIDLVSCRNLLIYLAAESRAKALGACSKALKLGGILFLGPSELPGPLMAELAPVHSKWRIYRKVPLPAEGSAFGRLPRLQSRLPAETIEPPPINQSFGAVPPVIPGNDQPGPLDGIIEQNQQMLESTIDTLLASNDALRRRNRDLRLENQRLTAANAALDDIATMVAHDLKAPLRTVDHLTRRIEAALAAGHEADGLDDDFRHMQFRLFGLHRLIDDLLTYARQGTSDGSAVHMVDVGELLRDVLTLIGLPPGFKIQMRPPALTVCTVRTPLECILRNLLGNALEHHGGASGNIQIDVTPIDHALDVKITDDGQGFAGHREGLGLAIVRQLLAAQGGDLTLKAPQSGLGTEARFTWPIHAQATVGSAG